MDRQEYNELGGIILDASIRVHRELGAGLLESVYQISLVTELELRGIKVDQKIAVPLYYRGINTNKYFEIDILVEAEIILELKASNGLPPVFMAQLLTYLKLSNKKLGYLINFNVPLLKDGFKRVVCNF
jgi:GxxExxY protein